MTKTAGSTPFVLGGLLVLAVLQPVACDGDGKDGGPSVVADALADALAAVGPEVVSPTLARAHAAADGLVTATAAWSADPDSTELQAATQEAWRALMSTWQEAELLQLGPAGPALTAVEGESLRDEVYSWPTVNPCRVDQETVAAQWSSPTFFADELVNVYGLDALETLLFSPAGVNACAADVDINADGSWTALGAGVQARRAEYAAALAVHVAATIADLEDRWDPAIGDFSGTLAGAGGAGSPYDSPEAGLNAVFDALYYLETQVQEAKLAEPLGLGDCVGEGCSALVETPVAGGSQDWIEANLRGFRLLFTGGEGAGMDDVLDATGNSDLADAVIAAVDEADRVAAELAVPIDVAATTDPAPAVAVLDAIHAVTELLEGDVRTVLALQLPAEADGDND